MNVRPAVTDDFHTIAPRLREADKRELKSASGGLYPLDALLVANSGDTNNNLVVEHDGLPVAMFGTGAFVPDFDIIWMVATPDIEDHPIEFLRGSKRWVRRLLRQARRRGVAGFTNFVDSRNHTHVLWLKWVGAIFTGRDTLSDDGIKFKEFYIV